MQDLPQISSLFLAIVYAKILITAGYDGSFWCRQIVPNSTATSPEWVTVTCPADTGPTDSRIPGYCCTTGKLIECCEWSTFLVNSAGFGRTSLGLVFFVCFFFVGALFVVAICCACFRVCFVLRWDQHDHHHATRITDSRQSSFRPTARRGGSVDTVNSVPLLAGDKNP